MVRGFGGEPVVAVVLGVLQVALHAVVLEQRHRPGPGVHAHPAPAERPVREQVAAVLRHRQRRPGDTGRGVPAGQALVRLGQEHPVRQVGLGVLADRVVHAGRHVLALAGGQPVVQRAQDGHDGHLARDVVGLPHLRRDRRGLVETGRVGIVAAVQHDPAQGQVDQVAGGVIGPRPGVAERRDPRPDQPGIVHRDVVVPDPAPGQVAARPGVDHHVGCPGQPGERLAALGGVQIQHHRPLAEVVVPEVQAAVGVRLVVVERPEPPGGLAAGRLDPHHIRPEPGQHLAAVLAEFVTDLQDPDPAQEAGEVIGFGLARHGSPPSVQGSRNGSFGRPTCSNHGNAARAGQPGWTPSSSRGRQCRF